MAFDKPTRNRLASFVSEARNLIADEFRQQFQSIYGIAEKGAITPLDQLRDLDDAGLSTATLLRERIEYLVRTHPDDKDGAKAAVDRLAREQAFTVLNRLAAVRLAEKRDLIVESVGKGYQSRGFKVFEQVAGSALGDTYQRYRRYLFCLFDELAVDLGVLFDRRSPQGLLFPREPALLELLRLLNAPDLEALWIEDETIGWIYQYYNDPAERKKMRDESAAPRNSRELAVRNQFFTPRYVVEFLTDNTLGRIWYEMTQGQTRLKEQCRYLVRRPTEIFLKPGEAAPDTPPQDGLSQEELLKQPVYIAHRPLKDPRAIRMLDPACGSMHFGLYAFDLYEVIYEETWDLEDKLGADALRRPSDMKSLHGTYADKAAFLADVPRLIIEHNIHGIDIDPRAAQIAGLSLWLRAQRAWQQQRLRPQDRPHIRRSNIVCAEPMPGDETLLDEFLTAHLSATPEDKLLGQLVRRVFDAMRLAGEAGSLLKIEEEIAGTVEEAKQKWLARPKMEQGRLFADAATPTVQMELALDVTGITDETFWEKAEEHIYAALQSYAEQTENGRGFQHRLFAEDAARGFAFIDLCRQRYDVVLMNPPFGLGPKNNLEHLKQAFPDGYVDLFACFISRGAELCFGRLGAITSRAFMIAKKLERLRSKTVLPYLNGLLDLGWPVMDGAMVQSAAFILDFSLAQPPKHFIAIDKKRAESKSDSLAEECAGTRISNCVFIVNRHRILYLVNAKILYSLPENIFALFARDERLGNSFLLAKLGMKSFDDFRFLRIRSEVSPDKIGPLNIWEPFAKGGSFAVFYSELPLLIKWRKNGEEISEVNRLVNGQTAQARQASTYYREPGATYSYRCKDFGVRILPSGFIISGKGPIILPRKGVSSYFILGLCNSRLVNSLVNLQANAKQYDSGIVEAIPTVSFDMSQTTRIELEARHAVDALRQLATQAEGDAHFIAPIVRENLSDIQSTLKASFEHGSVTVRTALSSINATVDKAYGIDSATLKAAIETEVVGEEGEIDEDTPEEDLNDYDDGSLGSAPEKIVESVFSYSVGIAFGRWDIRFATGEEPAPELPDPFAPLPVCPPGQLQNEQGLPITKEDVGRQKAEGRWIYPIEIPWDGILVDDPGHLLDLEARVHQVLQVIWSKSGNGVSPLDLDKQRRDGAATWENIEHEACEILSVKSLRDYFRKPSGFFADHLKRYSKSRRQAPIYWPLSTASGSYTLWIYSSPKSFVDRAKTSDI